VPDDLAATNGGYETEHATFERRRAIAIGLFAGAALTTRDVEAGVTVAPGAAAIQIGWRQ
jgi:hypothetical protein